MKSISKCLVGKSNLILLLALFLLFGCVETTPTLEPTVIPSPTSTIAPTIETEPITTADIKISEFSTNKETYGSYEEMIVSVVVVSSKNLKNVTINLFGIQPYRFAYINESKTVDIAAGKTQISFAVKTPSCTSGCGGVYPGSYEIHTEVLIDGMVVAKSTKNITLVGD